MKAVPALYGYQYHDCIRFDGAGRAVNGSSPIGRVPFYDQATIDRLVGTLLPMDGTVPNRLKGASVLENGDAV